MARDEDTKPDKPRQSVVMGVPVPSRPRVVEQDGRRARHPQEERSSAPPPPSIAPFPQHHPPTVIVEQVPPTRRSFFPRELPSWVGKAAAALFAAVVLPITLSVTRRIDAGTDLVRAEVTLKQEQIKSEQKRQEAFKAETEGVRALEVEVASLKALRSEVAQIKVNLEGTAEQVTELTPATRPPKRLKVRPE
jgi:hypothetical protein